MSSPDSIEASDASPLPRSVVDPGESPGLSVGGMGYRMGSDVSLGLAEGHEPVTILLHRYWIECYYQDTIR